MKAKNIGLFFKRSISPLLMMGVMCTGPVCAQDVRPNLELGQYLTEGLADWGIPGIAVAVVHKNETVFVGGAGVKQIGRRDQIDGKTLFQIGSSSKAFAAASVAVLVDQEILDWDDRVIDHLPWFNTTDDIITQQTTIRELLTHTSGVGGDIATSVLIISPEQAARRLSGAGRTQPTRGEFLYSNSGYGLIEVIIEAASGRTWKQVMEEDLFTPMRMMDSETTPYDVWDYSYVAPTFLGSAPAGEVQIENARGKNVALPHGYDRFGERRVLSWQSYDALAPAGNVVSNADDMANWLHMLLNNGQFGTAEVLSVDSVKTMISPHVVEKSGYFLFADEGSPATYGLGWTQEQFQGRTLVLHGGGIFGFPAFVAFFPEEQLGVAVMANGSTLSAYLPHQEVVAYVSERLLGLQPRDWRGEVIDALEANLQAYDSKETEDQGKRDASISASLPLEQYTGVYFSDSVGEARVELEGDQLRFRFLRPGEFSGDLEHWQGDEFRLHFDGGDGKAWSKTMVSFTVDSDAGRVTALSNPALLGLFEKSQK